MPQRNSKTQIYLLDRIDNKKQSTIIIIYSLQNNHKNIYI